MTEALHQGAENLSTAEVAEYLKDNLDFFHQYPDLLSQMNFSNQNEGAISLVDRQIKGLRQDKAELKNELQEVITNAKENQHLLQQTIELSLKLMPCQTIEKLTEVLFVQLGELFDINHRNLLLDKKLFIDSDADLPLIKATLGDNFPLKNSVCGRLKSAEKECLFDQSETVQSVAILGLGTNAELGLLVLGSEDETHFDPEMGDLFLTLITDMLSKLLSRFKE